VFYPLDQKPIMSIQNPTSHYYADDSVKVMAMHDNRAVGLKAIEERLRIPER